jgi:hypothetical protein
MYALQNQNVERKITKKIDIPITSEKQNESSLIDVLTNNEDNKEDINS